VVGFISLHPPYTVWHCFHRWRKTLGEDGKATDSVIPAEHRPLTFPEGKWYGSAGSLAQRRYSNGWT